MSDYLCMPNTFICNSAKTYIAEFNYTLQVNFFEINGLFSLPIGLFVFQFHITVANNTKFGTLNQIEIQYMY